MNELDTSARDIAIGVDLGGTNLRIAVYQGLADQRAAESGTGTPTPLVEHREDVGDERNPDEIANRLGAAVAQLLAQLDIDTGSGLGDTAIPIGIGFAGMLRGHDGIVANSPYFGWRDVDFGAVLRRQFADSYRIEILNDVNAITLGEVAFGAASGARDALAVFVGTGIGGGAVTDGNVVGGASNCAVEIGHTKVVWDATARQCRCGSSGCVEAYVGGDNLMRRAQRELMGGARSLATRLAGSPGKVHPGHLDAAASQGDRYALDLLEEVAPLLGVAMANAVTLLNPSHLILGGGVFSRTPVLKELAIAAFHVAVNPPAAQDLEIVDAALGDSAGLIGSALHASQRG